MADSDADYYRQRAEQEVLLAVQADHPKAAAAHRSLSVRYSARAAMAIVSEPDDLDDEIQNCDLAATIRSN
jgi:hypothetical protein